MNRDFVAPNPVDLSRLYRLGEMDIGYTLSVERDSGNIYKIDIVGFEGYSSPGFINSNVSLFSQFIKRVTIASDEDRAALRPQLTELDPRTMEDLDQGFWSTIVEEFEYDMW